MREGRRVMRLGKGSLGAGKKFLEWVIKKVTWAGGARAVERAQPIVYGPFQEIFFTARPRLPGVCGSSEGQEMKLPL